MSANPSWMPKSGAEFDLFCNNIKASPDLKGSLEKSALEILSHGANPATQDQQRTGLVVGYVQSGKTMSFESVITVAKDNGVRLVIVIAGVSNPLLDQSTQRLEKDFKITDNSLPRRWMTFKNPTITKNKGEIENCINSVGGQIVLITVLKQHSNLRNLVDLLKDIPQVPTLIIDDEADQAGLNSKVNDNDESTNYSRIIELRLLLRNHTYLQYTATPQAPLLINIIDNLSPDYVYVLEPGLNYTGGRVFFDAKKSQILRTIPQNDLFSGNDVSEPPTSYINALCVFLVGVALGLPDMKGNRTMLVHPSHKTINHQSYCDWTRNLFCEWKSLIKLSDSDQKRVELLDRLKLAYDDLKSTGGALEDFDKVVDKISSALHVISIKEVNARGGKTPIIDWHNHYGFILIGGNALDRGFTVEGLTVTYMPRSLGVGNVDTLQQRARFFGYRGSYINLCRVYLEQSSLNSYVSYVAHEEEMRRQLDVIQKSSQSLKNWRREFLLSPTMNPCRASVISNIGWRTTPNEWFYPSNLVSNTTYMLKNTQIAEDFLMAHAQDFKDANFHPAATKDQKYKHLETKLQDVVRDLLVDLQYVSLSDLNGMNQSLFLISKILDKNPNETCAVYDMTAYSVRERRVDDNDKTTRFKGASIARKGFKKGEVYPGDRLIRNPKKVSVHLYKINIKDQSGVNVLHANVYAIAIYIPKEYQQGWYIQD